MAQKYSYHLLITSPGGGETRDLDRPGPVGDLGGGHPADCP